MKGNERQTVRFALESHQVNSDFRGQKNRMTK